MNVKKMSVPIVSAMAIALISVSSLFAQYPEFPYPVTNYDEPYRCQFHFSPQGGWMNDVNGIWYYEGEYHLTFQHYPHGLAWAYMHWGRATSTDMIHWVQKPMALEPDVNVPGDCYSGSVVVDSANTSGFKTGTEDVFVAIYTATRRGTCLAYSNDKGATWQAYSGNPVAIGTTNESTRDPHVFWYAPTSRWVCAEWENATVFYTSPNLRTWTRASTLSFGFECPDIFELAVDEGATKKWVVMDAGANYHIGSFNGTTYTPDAGGPWKMDVGPDFYASQTFFRKNFPDNRVIQMAWVRGTLNTWPWTHEASFPCEVKLKTFAEGVRVSRFPIAEISNLHAASQNWTSQQLTSGSNLLSALRSKCFDLSAEFDLAGATATTINFTLPTRTVTYNITNRTLLGQSLQPISNRVKIRLLVDWGMLEVFGNDGKLSWTENVRFTPGDSTLGLSVNGNVNLVSMDFHKVARTWGPLIDLHRIDDPQATYNGTWSTTTTDAAYYNQTAHWGNTTGTYFQATFTGTWVSWYGLKNTDLGYADVYIDNVLVGDNIDCYSTTRSVVELFTRSGLTNASHTIRVTATGQKNAASSNTFIVHDYFAYGITGTSLAMPHRGAMSDSRAGNIMLKAKTAGVELRFGAPGRYEVTVVDVAGKTIAIRSVTGGTGAWLPAALFRNGTYFVRVSGREGSWTQKVVILR